MMAINEANVDAVLSVCSVGAIAPTFPPGKVALAEQYIDFTGVETTFHDDEAVFTSVTVPFDVDMNARLEIILRAGQATATMSRCATHTGWLKVHNLKRWPK